MSIQILGIRWGWTLCMACWVLALAGCALPGRGWRDETVTPSSRERRLATRDLKYPLHTHLAHARWQEEIGNVRDAEASYQYILSENPKSAEALLGLARIDQLAGRTDEAERRFRHAMRLKPNNPEVLAAAAQFYAAEERWPEALELQTAAVKAAPDAPEHRFQLGVLTAQSGHIEAALPHFQQAVGEAEAHYNIGRILYDQGRAEEAEQQFVLAALKKPELEHASLMLQKVRSERETGLAQGSSRTAPDPADRLAEWRPVFKQAHVETTTTPGEEVAKPRNNRIIPAGHSLP